MLDCRVHNTVDTDDRAVSRILLFGRTKEGERITLQIDDFNFYFYACKPVQADPKKNDTRQFFRSSNKAVLKSFQYKKKLEVTEEERDDIDGYDDDLCKCRECSDDTLWVFERFPKLCDNFIQGHTAIFENVNIVERKPFIGYKAQSEQMFKVVTTSAPVIRRIGYYFDKLNKNVVHSLTAAEKKAANSEDYCWKLFETNIDPVTRFLTDLDAACGSWISVSTVNQINFSDYGKNVFEVSCRDLAVMRDKQDNAPIMVFALDCEMITCDGSERFPTSAKDPIIQIACVSWRLTNPDDVDRVIFVVGTCDDLDNCDRVESFENEAQMLTAFGSYVVEQSPDILTGYNSDAFDFPYIFERAKRNGVFVRNRPFKFLSTWRTYAATFEKSTMQSNQAGAVEKYTYDMPGTVFIDPLIIFRQQEKLRSYSLNAVAEELLDDQKDDMPYSEIPILQRGSSADRAKIAHYCVQDTDLVRRLIIKRQLIVNLIEMAKVIGCTLGSVFGRGQQYKVTRKILEYTRKHGFVLEQFKRNEHGFTIVPAYDRIMNENKQAMAALDISQPAGKGFQGATVLEPVRGFHNDTPVVCLDFASLYPSIMRYNNLSHDSFLLSREHAYSQGLTDDDITQAPNGFLFVKQEQHDGILPMILTDLLDARKRAKKQMKNAVNAMEKSVWNGQQLALKICCNSVYGFTGAKTSAIPCVAIAAAVTSFGREMIYKTKTFMETRFEAQVVYGDTDSVFVKFPGISTVAEAIEMGKQSEKAVHDQENGGLFDGTVVKLEYEKTLFPFFIAKKKRYFSRLYEFDAEMFKVSISGFQATRRDNTPLCAKTQREFIDMLLANNVTGGLTFVVEQIRKLFDNDIDIEDLTLSKKLSKMHYKSPQIHVELAKRISIRTPALAPKLGTRVPYVVVKTAGKLYDSGEDPAYTIKHRLALDLEYYYTKQLLEPLTPIFEDLIGVAETRLFFQRARQGGLDAFAGVDEKVDWVKEIKLKTLTKKGAGKRDSLLTENGFGNSAAPRERKKRTLKSSAAAAAAATMNTNSISSYFKK